MRFLSNLSYYEPEGKRKRYVKLKKEQSEVLYQVNWYYVAT